MTEKRFARYTLFVLLFTLLVIVWGGFVSASGSGDGCGDRWPLCGASTSAPTHVTRLETFIELFHRLTSGLALIAVVVQLFFARRLYPTAHLVRRAAWWSLFFMLTESAVGAVLVLARLVAENNSLARAFIQPIHLINTNLLLASLVLLVWYAHGGRPLRWNNRLGLSLLGLLAGWVLLSSFGTIASLASTIFPSQSFLEGVQKDFSTGSHYLIRLRVLHPLLAVGVGVYLGVLGRYLQGRFPDLDNWLFAIYLLFGLQFALGGLNAMMLSPIFLQLAHLIFADTVWMLLIWVSAHALTLNK